MKRAAFWFRVAVLFLWRSGRVSSVLALMILTAVAALVFLSSLATGVNDAMIRNSVGLYAGHISGTGLPVSVPPEALRVKGVATVLKRIPRPGLLAAGEHVVPATLMAVAPEAEAAATGLPRKMVAGHYLTPLARQILLSTHLADRLRVDVGASVAFIDGRDRREYRWVVCGIYRTGVDRLDYGLAFVPQENQKDAPGEWEAAVFLKAGVPPEDVKRRLEKAAAPPAVFRSWIEMMPDLRQLIDLNYVSMNLVTVLVFGVVAIGVACAFVVFVLKHVREYGIMRSMGVSTADIGWLIGAEILILSLLASCLGVLVGAAAVALVARTGIDLTAFTSHNRYFTVSGMIYPRLTGYALGGPPLAAVGFSLAASLWPIALIGRKKVADILRMV
jgi:ABC-type lipoprotein release transport system permease subunit